MSSYNLLKYNERISNGIELVNIEISRNLDYFVNKQMFKEELAKLENEKKEKTPED